MLMSRTPATLRNPFSYLLAVGSMLAVMTLFATGAQAGLVHPYTGQSFGPEGFGAGTFEDASSVAVDQGTGDVFVYEAGEGGRVHKFNAAGEPVDFSSSGTNMIAGVGYAEEGRAEIAVDSSGGPDAGDIYLANNSVIHIYSAAGVSLGELTGAEPCGVAVDPSGSVYVGSDSGTVTKYVPVTNPVSNSNEQASMGGLSGICNVAADSEGDVYAARYIGGVTRYAASQFGQLAAEGTVISPGGSTLAVDTSTNDVYVNEGSEIVEYDPAGELIGRTGSGIISIQKEFGVTRSFGVAIKGGPGGDMYAPAGGSRIDIFGPAIVMPLAHIYEESFSRAGSSSVTFTASVNDFGTPSTYYYEYGPTNVYGSTTPKVSLGAVNGRVGAPAHIDGLQPGTTYQFRLVVENEEGVLDGVDIEFSTLPIGILGLPDGRGYEMVTPPDNEDAQMYAPTGAGSSAFGTGVVPTFLPVRAAADGSAIAYVGEPTAEGNGNMGRGNEYIATRGPEGWVQKDIQPTGFFAPEFVAFSEDLSTGVLESFEPLVPGAPEYPYQDLYTRNEDGSLHALSMVTPPNRGTYEFGVAEFEGALDRIGHAYGGASLDFKHQFFEANDALTPGAIDGGSSQNNLYESFEGDLRLVNVLPDGSTEPDASFGAPPIERLEAPNVEHAISADGSHAFWTDIKTGALYVRENGATTVLIAEHATFWTASSDGSRVIYAKNGDLYEDDLSADVTTDLTPGGQVKGIVGAGEDASYVYFIAEGSLAPGAVAGQPNLYLRHSAATTLIATLPRENEFEKEEFVKGVYSTESFSDSRPVLGRRTAEATPDGHALVFMSKHGLTGNDNRNEAGVPQFEVYVYDAVSGALSCASCSPSGERPNGASSAAGYLPLAMESGTFQLRLISEDGGRVIFQSTVPLVAQDVNGVADVYEWERDGVGSCNVSAGCVYLLSNGASKDPSFLLDASADGSDIFIVTSAKLVAQDENELYDVYDVRIGAKTLPVPPECTGTGCQGLPGAPPIFATPSSMTFNGVGNFAPPAKVTVKKKPKAKKKTKRKHSTKRQAKKKHKRHVGSTRTATKTKIATSTNGKGGR